MTTHKYTRKHYHMSEKAAGPVHAESSYELRAAILLDENPEVISYEDHRYFLTESGKKRVYDYLATYRNGEKKVIEVKPSSRLHQFEEQIKDNREYAMKNGWLFEIWTESNLGFETSNQITAWADEYIRTRTGIDYAGARKEKNLLKTKRHYRSKIATNTVTVFCQYCNEEHTALKLTHDRNIARNGRYICEREGGHIAGSKPKLSLRKVNPYASEGKKQCKDCERILEFASFSPDKTKTDGYCTLCKECRSTKMKARYQAKKRPPSDL